MKDFKAVIEVPGESWTKFGQFLRGENEQDVKDRLTYRYDLTDEHTIEVKETKVFPSTEKITVDSYPYGRKRTTAFFSVEWTKNGFREVFQTVNPATGLLNKEKKSTYAPAILPTFFNGFADFAYAGDFNGKRQIDSGVLFMESFFEMFTPEQNESIYKHVLALLFVDIKATIIYKGAKKEDILGYYTESIEAAKYGISRKGAENVYGKIHIDEKAILSHCPENYQPFKVVSHHDMDAHTEERIA